MGERFFQNEMPDYLPETPLIQDHEASENRLLNLLSMEYNSFASLLESQAIHVKQMVVAETWVRAGQQVVDFTLYVGALGTAFLLFKAYQVVKEMKDLSRCLQIIEACDHASCNSRDVTFICGRAGVCALGAVVAKHTGNDKLLDYYLTQFKQIDLPKNLPNELLYGRAGFLWACLFINKHVGDGTIPPKFMRSIITDIISSGRNVPNKGESPLMFEWYGERYWGAAHGLAGIMHVLLETDLKPDEREDVKYTLLYMIKNRFPSGNYRANEEDNRRDVLVHWCHGAPGVCLTLVKAYEVFGDNVFLEAAIEAGEVVWRRGLLKRVGICHGISGNTYVFLSLFRVTRDVKYLYRAKAFASFLLENAQTLMSSNEMHCGDNPYSLFEGIGGMAYLFLDMNEPNSARFPAYEL